MQWGLAIFRRQSSPAHESPSTIHRVLCDGNLFTHIASFQLGFPRDVVDLVRANDTSFRPRGWLPALVVATDDVRFLQRLYRLYSDQSAVFKDRPLLSFGGVWLDALQAGKIEMAEWIDNHKHIRSDHAGTVALRFAIASQRVETVQWLLQRRPQYMTQFAPQVIAACTTIEMFQWVETMITPLPSLTPLIDGAAEHGRLKLLQYVYSHHPSARFSSRAIDSAASNGHVAIVQFVHEHAHNQCSSNAIRYAAWNGHIKVVEYLNGHCSAVHGDAFELAALAGHLTIVQYLARTRTDINVMRAHALVTRSGHHPAVQAYLSAILNPTKHMARHRDHMRHKSRRFCGLL